MSSELLEQLRMPFHPSKITWKPQAVKENRAMAIAYADPRAYMERLDEVCGMEWSITYTPWGDRVVAHLTIRGVTRSSTGEPDKQSEKSEIAGTAAEAQAFKRACAMFGLGRYLYDLPSLWVDYDPQARTFTDKGRAKLEMTISQHYRRVMDNQSESNGQPPVTTNGNHANGDKDDKSPAFKRLMAEGTSTFGKEWDDARHWLIERYTRQATPQNIRKSANDLYDDECTVIADALSSKRKSYQDKWKEHKTGA